MIVYILREKRGGTSWFSFPMHTTNIAILCPPFFSIELGIKVILSKALKTQRRVFAAAMSL